jgi:hypothetical protein
LHGIWGKVAPGKSALRKPILGFPQAFVGVLKPDARNGNKIQDIVVCC